MSNNLSKAKVWLVGAGPMAIAYASVLKAMGITPIVIGRGVNSAKKFTVETGIHAVTGGLESFLLENKPDSETSIIITTGPETLLSSVLAFKNLPFAKILVEKPAAISVGELLAHQDELDGLADKVMVAYNRRYYASVIRAKELIEADGGLQSMHFEFTEWAHKIEPLEKASGVKENWFFANSTHVVDLAFFLAGNPKDWSAYSKAGKLTWHSKTNFSGAGITENGVLFSYLSNWESAGRWGIELMTYKRRIYLKPLEGIQIQNKGSILVEEYAFDKEIDDQFKPGLYNQVEDFLETCSDGILSLREHARKAKDVYAKILGE